MLPDDNIFNVILTHRLPVSRNNQTVKEFLKDYFDEYIQSLEKALIKSSNCFLRDECYSLVEEKIPIIRKLCNDIIEIFDLYDSANMKTFYSYFEEMMKRIEKYINIKNIRCIGNESFKNLFRIRSGENKYSRLDMFHIPMGKRQLIKSYRYSIPGYPCLYLSTGMPLCWFECGMPTKFSYCSFDFNILGEERIKLINFTCKPVNLISAISLDYYNEPEKKDETDLYLIKYLVTHPLRVACSMQVVSRNNAFIQEYIFPQQLLLWIREHKNFDGVAYRTASAVEKAKEWNYFNIVLPAEKLNDNGYCEKLAKLFKVTEPIKVDLGKLVEEKHKDMNIVHVFIKKLENKYYNGYALYPYEEMLSICKTFLLLCNSLSSSEYNNDEITYQTMDTLNLTLNIIIKNKESIKEKSMEEALELFYNKDQAIIETEYDDIFNDFSEKIQPIIFSFWHYTSLLINIKKVDRKTFDFVL
ncbi:hypothetical protein [Clostridium sp. DL1XJH146]